MTENAGIEHLNDSKAFIECSNTMDDVYEDTDDYNPTTRRKILIAFDCMIADIMSNKKFPAVVKELFIRCRKLNISLAFITKSYFSVPKDVRLYSVYYLIMKINNKRESQNHAINHSADIDYNNFLEIYRECTKEPYCFLTTDIVLAIDPLRFRKIFFFLIEIIVTDQFNILDRKIKQNKAQYDLYRKAAKIAEISALSSGSLDKYEYLTGEDLNYEPSTIEQAKFDYSPMKKIFNKGLKVEDKKEGFLKRLRNIEDKKEEQLKAIKNKTKDIKEVTNFVQEPLSLEANALINEIRRIQKYVDYRKFKIKAVTMLGMVLMIIKHLKSYLETFITEICR